MWNLRGNLQRYNILHSSTITTKYICQPPPHRLAIRFLSLPPCSSSTSIASTRDDAAVLCTGDVCCELTRLFRDERSRSRLRVNGPLVVPVGVEDVDNDGKAEEVGGTMEVVGGRPNIPSSVHEEVDSIAIDAYRRFAPIKLLIFRSGVHTSFPSTEGTVAFGSWNGCS